MISPNRNFCILMAVAAVLTGCAKRGLHDRPPAAVAVWDIENLSPGSPAQVDLGEILSGKVIQTITSAGNYRVVERQRLVLALEELNLGTSDVVNDATRLKIGAMAGAQFMVFGGYQSIGGLMRLDLRMVGVETGKVVAASQRTVSGTDPSAWLEATREATLELVK